MYIRAQNHLNLKAMAKGNLFLGFARRSVGDVVFYRLDGEQVSRARNRKPANPNTTKQALQRAVTASVQRLYSAGMQLFNHSFEGKSVGMGNQREFVKRNMAILRAALVTDMNDQLADDESVGRVSAPGISTAVPFVGMQVSNGSYPQNLFSYSSASQDFKMPAASSGETVAAYAQRVGLVAGDIYTVASMGLDNSSSPQYSVDAEVTYASLYQSYFDYCQFKVKAGLESVEDVITNATTLATFFDAVGGTVDLSTLPYNDGIGLADLATMGSNDGVIFCIRSRFDSGLRSASFAMAATQQLTFGLTHNYLLQAWRDKAGITDVELILEGRDFQ